VHGTTLITNTIIERRGAVVGFITTKGFKDILRIGKGYRYNEFAGFCLPMEEADSRFEESLEVITKAFTSETPFSHGGKYWQFENIVVEPPTAQRPHPPFWMGAGSASSVRQVAERGYNMLLGQHSLAEEILEQVAQFYYVFLGLAVLAWVLSARVENSRIGRAWKYVRYDEDAAEAMGIDRVAVKLYAYMLGAVFAAVAGCFYAARMTAISPETFSFAQSVLILVGVVLGGMGKIPGVALGAVVLTVFPEVFRAIGSTRMLVFAVLLLLLMLFRPHGLWPDRRA